MSAFLDSQGLTGHKPHESDPEWLANLRQQACGAVLASGLPTSKTEAWRFTSLRKLEGQSVSPASAMSGTEAVAWAKEQLGDDETLRVYLVNGQPIGESASAEGLDVTALDTIFLNDPDSLKAHLGKLAHSEFFAGINAALFVDGYALRIKSTHAGKPVHIVHIADATTNGHACYPRILIELEANAQANVIETYLSRAGQEDVCTAVTEVHLANGAKLDHLRVMEGDEGSTHLGTLAVLQERNSKYTSRSVAVGGKLSRLEIDARMSGPGAECHLDGMYHAVGSEHVAHHTLITHADSHCTSTEEYRGIVDDRAHAVFDGIINVDQGTKGTSAHQQNHNLLLSDTATINTKPHLEIDSDDLTASHGATIGSVDPDHLFFLRARGIDENHARSILTFSFVRSILDRIECEPVRDRLTAKLLSRLPYGDDIAELAK
ncbi:MAG: Fe-S cluster assembly protein SufD [Myxococcales bacterium]|nr:Fe-S cluster assembly protein SufD [Myxococcales bacterium]